MRTGELYQRYYGHYIATIVDVSDPEKLGRVRVQADQFADTMDQPIWASISRPAAGNQQGVFFTPKKGDQVILGFIAGDVREPMVMGYSHSTQNAPDTSLVSPQKHGIVTTIGSVVFDEQNGNITVTLVGPTPSVVTMDRNAGITIAYAGGTPQEAKATLSSIGINLAVGPTSVSLDSTGLTVSAPLVTLTAGPGPMILTSLAAISLTAGTAIALVAPPPPTGGGVTANGAPVA